MEYAVLYDYIKNQKDTRINWIAILKSLGIFKLILLVVVILSCLNSIIMLFIDSKITNPILFVSILSELLSVLVLNFVGQKESVSKSKEGIEKLDQKFDEIKDWLESIGFVDKKQIKQLCNRCNQEILRNKEKNNQFKQSVDRLFTLFLIPIFVASVSWVLGLVVNIPDRIALVIMIGFLGIILYILIFGLIGFFQPLIDSNYEKMSKMVKEIQGMLDRKFPVEDSDLL